MEVFDDYEGNFFLKIFNLFFKIFNLFFKIFNYFFKIFNLFSEYFLDSKNNQVKNPFEKQYEKMTNQVLLYMYNYLKGNQTRKEKTASYSVPVIKKAIVENYPLRHTAMEILCELVVSGPEARFFKKIF